MSSQSDLNNNAYPYMLYYLGVNQSDPTLHSLDCSDFCTLSYDGSNNIQIDTWTSGYAQPSMPTLLGFTLSAVLAWYDNYYILPMLIANYQPYRIGTTDLAAVRTDSSMLGYVVMDTTSNQERIWTGSAWVAFSPELYVTVDGSQAMAANLDLAGNNIVAAANIYQSTPSGVSFWSSNSVGISFTASTPQPLAITGFTVAANPNSDFSVNTSTGQATYTGASTRWFRVTVDFSYDSLAPGSTQTLTTYLSKDGATSISGKRKVVTFVPSGQTSTYSDSITDLVQLAHNDTIQLGGDYSASATVTYSNVSYTIVQA